MVGKLAKICVALIVAPFILSEVMGAAAPAKPVCRSFTETFSKPRIVGYKSYKSSQASKYDWVDLSGRTGAYSVSKGILSVNLKKPSSYKVKKDSGGRYNSAVGQGVTFNSTHLIQYGKISGKIKVNKVGGVVTAFITLAPKGDEIDWEWVGSDKKHVQSNFFWHAVPEYGVNGGNHLVSGASVSEGFHTYELDWSPDSLSWVIDGKVVRTLHRVDTLRKSDGKYHYPSQPSYIQMGIWDGSGSSGVASWSQGPVDWKNQPSTLSSYWDEVTIQCDPTYNKVIH